MTESSDNLEFPIKCHYRIIAEDVGNIQFVIETVLMELGVKSPVTLGNQSKEGKYQTFNVDIVVESKEMMNKIDAELRAIQGVKMVL